METETLQQFTDWAVRFIRSANDHAATLDGRVAFVLGLLTWFVVEQAIRRMAGALRIAIIVAALGASGLGVATFLGAFDQPAAQDAGR